MSQPRGLHEAPWQPTLDSLPVFNPFVSPVEHLELRKPVLPPEEELLPEDEQAPAAGAPPEGTPA